MRRLLQIRLGDLTRCKPAVDLLGDGRVLALGPILELLFEVVLIHVSGLQIVMKISVPHGWQGAQTAGSASSYAVKTVLRAVFAVQTGEADADSAATDFAPRSPSGAKSDPFAVTAATVAVPPDVSPTSVPPAPHILPGAAGGRDSSISVLLEELEPICKGWTDYKLPILVDPEHNQHFPWGLARDVLIQHVKFVEPAERVSDWWRENIAVMDQMKEYDPDSHKIVVKAFEDRRHQLIKESKEKQK